MALTKRSYNPYQIAGKSVTAALRQPGAAEAGKVPVWNNVTKKWEPGAGGGGGGAEVIPGVYFSPAQNFDSTFVVFASAIAKPNGPYVLNNPIVWSILDHTTAHNSSFFSSITADVGNLALSANFPRVKNVLNGYIKGDESFNIYGVSGAAPSISLTAITGHARIQKPYSITIRGNGAGGWTKRGDATAQNALDLGAYAGGGSPFNIIDPVFGVVYESLQITYSGLNNYGIRRVYSGLGAYNAKFVLVNPLTGDDLATSPTVDDEVTITSAGASFTAALDMYKWRPENQFMLSTPSFNFWIYGIFEAWMVAGASSNSVIKVRWQPVYPGATNYKIYRDVNADFSTQVLIHTGVSGSYEDAGLAAGTLYHYKLVGVVGGIDTDITTFRANTNV